MLTVTISEVEKLKGRFRDEDHANDISHNTDSQSDDLNLAKVEAAKAQESLRVMTDVLLHFACNFSGGGIAILTTSSQEWTCKLVYYTEVK